ncbi:bleomycin resistance protein [Arthrobacter sp. SW1]|uniref:VOC family protein n=1 Tax=Arthrobacter sp. SW1 TaxID=1920889 RepID=UPI000877B562|nr:VOC family protein [Arthrobacter sp. SW1]OFI36909.1 bleomycin resistance protein [Arthrobacter sp. SW1]
MQARIHVTSVFVDDQAKALEFYTEKLGFVPKEDVPAGDYRWLTVVGAGEPDGVQLLLEPDQHPAAQAYKKALVADGIPAASFAVEDVESAHKELEGQGVTFTQPPVPYGPVITAVFDDTCGNLIQLVSPAK